MSSNRCRHNRVRIRDSSWRLIPEDLHRHLCVITGPIPRDTLECVDRRLVPSVCGRNLGDRPALHNTIRSADQVLIRFKPLAKP
eukprot:8848739-Heterocapsa_arctica.AAC.1